MPVRLAFYFEEKFVEKKLLYMINCQMNSFIMLLSGTLACVTLEYIIYVKFRLTNVNVDSRNSLYSLV